MHATLFFCWIVVVPAFADMSGIIPLDEEEEHEQELYDDVGALDEDIYEVLPGLTAGLHWQHSLSAR